MRGQGLGGRRGQLAGDQAGRFVGGGREPAGHATADKASRTGLPRRKYVTLFWPAAAASASTSPMWTSRPTGADLGEAGAHQAAATTPALAISPIVWTILSCEHDGWDFVAAGGSTEPEEEFAGPGLDAAGQLYTGSDAHGVRRCANDL